jgi:anti-sigma factor RsiW
MPLPEQPAAADRSVRDAVRRRERGLRRVSATTRWVAAAAVAGTAVLGAGYAHALPGIAVPAGSARHGSGTSTGTSGSLQPAGQAPAPTSQTPQTQSGAS